MRLFPQSMTRNCQIRVRPYRRIGTTHTDLREVSETRFPPRTSRQGFIPVGHPTLSRIPPLRSGSDPYNSSSVKRSSLSWRAVIPPLLHGSSPHSSVRIDAPGSGACAPDLPQPPPRSTPPNADTCCSASSSFDPSPHVLRSPPATRCAASRQ